MRQTRALLHEEGSRRGILRLRGGNFRRLTVHNVLHFRMILDHQ